MGALGHSDVKLVITIGDIDRPVYRVRFDGHSDLTVGGGNSNWREAEAWSSRLTATSIPRTKVAGQ